MVVLSFMAPTIYWEGRGWLKSSTNFLSAENNQSKCYWRLRSRNCRLFIIRCIAQRFRNLIVWQLERSRIRTHRTSSSCCSRLEDAPPMTFESAAPNYLYVKRKHGQQDWSAIAVNSPFKFAVCKYRTFTNGQVRDAKEDRWYDHRLTFFITIQPCWGLIWP